MSKQTEKEKWQRNKGTLKYKLRRQRYRDKLRRDIIYHYSNGNNECSCCREKEFVFLCVDHVNNDGNKHREQVSARDLYRWLRVNNYPSGFQILCWNCNFAKSLLKKCPHSQ